MLQNLLFFYTTVCVVFRIVNGISDEIIFNYNNTYKYNVPYSVEVSRNVEYVMEFGGDLEAYITPARVTVASEAVNRSFPVFITARQQRGVFSWQLPMLVQTPGSLEKFTNISRTLCPHNNVFSRDEVACDLSENTPIIHITSSSPDPIRVTVVVETVQDFYIKLNTTTNLTITPSQPMYYFYPFNQESSRKLDLQKEMRKKQRFCDAYGDEHRHQISGGGSGWLSRPKSVIVLIESDDDICAVISIQNFSCPVFDNERDILYDGYYLTMTRRGGITLTQDLFPMGFFIVFIVKTVDEDCTDAISNTTVPKMAEYFGWSSDTINVTTNGGRVKQFSFKIVETITYQEYLIAAGAALAFFLSFYVAFGVALVCQKRRRRSELEDDLGSPIIPYDNNRIPEIRHRGTINNSNTPSRSPRAGNPHPSGASDIRSSSDTESDHSKQSRRQQINNGNEVLFNGRLCVADLSRCRPRVLATRSKLYLWNVLTVTVFYTLPVIQLVVTYQRLLNQSGNQDLCYFNFLCAHPLVFLSDFNHVYSNLGYVLLGALFLMLVWRRHRMHKAKTREQKQLGIPQHFGLLYAMGIALVSEGVLSAAYHVCPNSMNFQFDTSFMYVTAALCMVKLYQARHADVNARAHATFGVLALIIFIGLVGVLNANFYFWVMFTILHVVMCLIMTFQIYYLGRFRFDMGVVCRAARQLVRQPIAAMTPTHCGRCVMLIIANLVNWAIAGYGLSQHSRDFASHLLLVMMGNLFLYTLFYIVMKLLHRERIKGYSWVFIVITYTIWFSSSYFYLDLSTNWALTPAQSRQSNRMCSLLQLYDGHDIWHFMSATAMFFSFNMYLTIDDNLADVPRENMMVF